MSPSKNRLQNTARKGIRGPYGMSGKLEWALGAMRVLLFTIIT
jgi:hypothetical protein